MGPQKSENLTEGEIISVITTDNEDESSLVTSTDDPIIEILFTDFLKDDPAIARTGMFLLAANHIETVESAFERIAVLGGLNLIACIMRKWPDDDYIQCNGCHIILGYLRNIDEESHLSILIEKFKYFDILFSATEKHKNDDAVQLQVLLQLTELAENRDSFKQELVRYWITNSDVQSQLILVIRCHYTNVEIQKAACQFFEAIANIEGSIPHINAKDVRQMIGMGFIHFNDDEIEHADYRKQAYKTLEHFKD